LQEKNVKFGKHFMNISFQAGREGKRLLTARLHLASHPARAPLWGANKGFPLRGSWQKSLIFD
jgi:hypothetical protein